MEIPIIIKELSPVNFGYHHPLKTAYKKGLMPDVKFGIYLKPLTNKTVTLEHATPASQGGKLTWSNTFLADKVANSIRGVEDFRKRVTDDMIILYLKQFINVKNRYVDGKKYIKAICKRFNIDINKIYKEEDIDIDKDIFIPSSKYNKIRKKEFRKHI